MILILQIALGIVLAIVILNFLPEILKITLVFATIAVPILIFLFIQIFVPDTDKQNLFETLKEVLIGLIALVSISGILLYTIKIIGPKILLYCKNLWQILPSNVRHLSFLSIFIINYLAILFAQIWLFSKDIWPLFTIFISPFLIFILFTFYKTSHSLASLFKTRGRLILLISAFWVVPSVSSYFIGIWYYPSFITNTLSDFYTWVEAATILDHGIDFTPTYPTVNYLKLIGLVIIPIITASPIFFRFTSKVDSFH